MASTLGRVGLKDLRDRLSKRLRENPADAGEVLEEALTVRHAFTDRIQYLLDVHTVEQRDLLASEARQFDELKQSVLDLDPLIKRAQVMNNRNLGRPDDWEKRIAQTLAASQLNEERALAEWRAKNPEGENMTNTTLSVRNEPTTYRPDREHSYFGDLAKRALFGDSDAAARLQRHSLEVTMGNSGEARAAGRSTAGDFTPPAWLLNQYVAYSRAGRVTANLCEIQGLPEGASSIKLPRIATGTVVAAQTADNATVTSTDVTTDVVDCPVNTYAGVTNFSLQMLEQSPVQLDQVIFRDLIAALALGIGQAVLTGTGANGQVEGILTNTSTSTVTYTSTSPTASGLYSKIGYASQLVAANINNAPDAVVMHPRRFLWLASQVDSTGRPLIVPVAGGSQAVNAMSPSEAITFDGPVGSIMGLPIYLDNNIPVTKGASSNEDVIIVGRFAEATLYETGPKAQVFFEPGAATMTVLARAYNYAAFSGARRRPKAFSIIGGTGLATVLS